ncbi:MAG: hypothetical protein KKA65_01415 [Nanoarchaeota archaeon]|nr:hypothetical protein [Nanoarchaeota archaeon]MBU4241671.1 hypothetical protein [Nanoarchaeota archaeon]MBU4352149.1 hypothetical protein [Nanoarchaeota archaeon]MBU4456135.1 hypothetical protein [Nanoarchaeota archaeon]MCG2719139.1 hypothetical protein [Nanoarchaeota archaeon]
MSIVGLGFDKLLVDKKRPVQAPLKINSNLVVTSLEKVEGKNPLLKFNYEFKLNYDPKIAEVIVGGHVLYTDKEKILDNILKEWKKNKKVDPDLVKQIINVAIIRSNMKAIMLAEQVSLPPHIRFPVVAGKGKKSDYIS